MGTAPAPPEPGMCPGTPSTGIPPSAYVRDVPGPAAVEQMAAPPTARPGPTPAHEETLRRAAAVLAPAASEQALAAFVALIRSLGDYKEWLQEGGNSEFQIQKHFLALLLGVFCECPRCT
eukprot:4179205-Amphidinium_carterae.1